MMTLDLAPDWRDRFYPAPWTLGKISAVASSAGKPMRAVGVLAISIVTSLFMAAPAYAQASCSARVTAILNDSEANRPPNFSGIWEAYECSSCEGVRVDLREYNFEIEHKSGKVKLFRDLHETTFGPIKLNGRMISSRSGLVKLDIEFSQDGTKFEGSITYSNRIPGRLMIFGKLSDKEASAKRRQLSEKRRNLSNRALTLARQCLKKFEAMNVTEKTARANQLETELNATQAQLKATQDDLKQAVTLSSARTQILQVYAEGILKGGQRNEACTLFRAMVMMDPSKASLLGKHGC